MFKVVEYRRAKSAKAKVGRFTRRKVIREFDSLEAARQFIEGRNLAFIQYPRSYIKEMQA